MSQVTPEVALDSEMMEGLPRGTGFFHIVAEDISLARMLNHLSNDKACRRFLYIDL